MGKEEKEDTERRRYFALLKRRHCPGDINVIVQRRDDRDVPLDGVDGVERVTRSLSLSFSRTVSVSLFAVICQE